jgi:hypothetical protein
VPAVFVQRFEERALKEFWEMETSWLNTRGDYLKN